MVKTAITKIRMPGRLAMFSRRLISARPIIPIGQWTTFTWAAITTGRLTALRIPSA